MDEFVADASVAIAWVHPAQATAACDALLRSVRAAASVRAPALFPLETANTLLVLVRRGKLSEPDCDAAVSALSGLRLELDHEAASLAYGPLLDIARKHRL